MPNYTDHNLLSRQSQVLQGKLILKTLKPPPVADKSRSIPQVSQYEHFVYKTSYPDPREKEALVVEAQNYFENHSSNVTKKVLIWSDYS